MLLGVPTFAVIYYIIELIIDGRLHRKNLPESSDYYDEYSFVDDTGKYVISRETMEKKHKEKCEKEKKHERKRGITMPIRVQNDLPVKEILESENIFVMDEPPCDTSGHPSDSDRTSESDAIKRRYRASDPAVFI